MDKYLRCVIFGGDKLLPLYLHDWLDTYPLNKIKLINMYGITETTVHVTYHYLSGDDISVNNQVSNIGKALPETTVYILNENLELQPVGIPGELYIGGSGVCRGYLNRGALTGERFIKNPYNCEEVIYRSGDLGRWLHDGRLEYIGRIDHQVKIRGFRIELGEIETQILTHDDIDEAVVIVREDSTTGGSDSKSGDKYLCAYIVSKNGKELSTSELRDYLSNRLPGYMVPAYFVRLAEISLTLNGKIDRKSLPDPELKAGEEYTAPRNYPEKKLVEIFSTVLGLDEGIIGIESDFFEYGGHSVNAINIIAKIHKELNVKIQIGDLFRKPTVRELGEHIMGEAETKYTSIVPSDRKEYYPLSAGQKKLFIIQRMYPQNISYNIFRTFYLEHFTDNEKLQEVFKKLIERHDSLRISFRVVNDEPVQFIHNNVDFEIEIKEGIEESEIRSIIYNFTKPFDLSKAPLLRICLINAGKNSILLVDMHHIISDGTSHEILQKDFLMLYEDKELPRLRLQYKDYIVWQNSKEYRGIISRQEKYWSNMFSGEIAVLDLPADFERPEMKSYEGSSFTFTLNKEETAILKDISKGEEATLFMTIFAVFNVLFSKLSGMEDITIGIAAEGRRHNNLKNILGLFVNLLPIRSYVDRRKTFKEFLQHIKKQVLDASENQEYQFENMLEKISVKQDNSRHPLFDVVINMANRPGTRVNIDGIVNQPGNENDNKHKTGTSQYDMTVTAVDCGERIQFFLQYCTKLYKLSTIERYMKYFKNILYSLSVTTDKKMSGIEIITQEEQSGFLNINSLSRR
jgi:tyrocidine synthetase-3